MISIGWRKLKMIATSSALTSSADSSARCIACKLSVVVVADSVDECMKKRLPVRGETIDWSPAEDE
jgi:hypothetical protein